MSSLIGFVLAASPLLQCPTTSQDRILDQVRSSFPYSIPNAMAVSADGRYIYSGEGGAVAILDTLAGAAGYGSSAPRIPVSRFGARPAKILVDARGTATYHDDLLILCAGRSGLWVMDAHPADGTTYRAAIVDDEVESGVAGQDSRRFCNDAALFSIGGTEYLAVIFARKNGSRLRIYDLAAVRGVLDSVSYPSWTGGEIAALHDIRLGRRRVLPHPVDRPHLHDYALSIALDVDQVDASTATCYLALWHQGLARVRFSQGLNGLRVSKLEYGPVFGDGTPYQRGLVPDLPHAREAYTNFRWIHAGEVVREEPPVFTDVAVQSIDGHYLYATVDTLGWVRFDLSEPDTIPWGPSMPIDHHEGQAFPEAPESHPFDEVQFSLEEGYTYPRQVRVIKSQQKTLVAVNTVGTSIVRNVGHRTEGSVFNYAANTFNAIPDYFFLDEALLGGQNAVLIYEIDPNDGSVGPPNDYDTSVGVAGSGIGPLPNTDPDDITDPVIDHLGGRDMAFLPAPAGGPNEPTLFVQPGLDTQKVRVDLGPPLTFHLIGERVAADRAGAELFKVGYSPINPDVLMLASNDGGFPSHGILATCGSEWVNFFTPDEYGGDGRLTMGIFFDQEGQWPVLSPDPQWNGMHFSLGSLGSRYRIRLVDPGDPCAVPPVEPQLVHTWKVRVPYDRFGKRARWYFQGTVNDAYDGEVGRKMLYVSGSSTPQGIVALDRAALEAWLFDNMGLNPNTPDSDTVDLDGAPAGIVVGTLNTDPELSNVPNGPETNQFLQTQYFESDPGELINTAGRLLTFTPRIVKVAGEPGGALDSWVLVAPCGFLDNGEEERDAGGVQFASFDEHNGVDENGQRNGEEVWTADPEYSDLTKLLVQFWDVSDPDSFDDSAESQEYGVPAGASQVGSHEFANAISLRTEEWQGRTYAFVADFGGRVQVFDMTDVLHGSVELVETWSAPKSLTDSLNNTVWDVVVDPAQWGSGARPQTGLYVYAAVERVGIEVLRFEPACPPGLRLREVGLIQTPGNVRSMTIRDSNGDKTLIVSDGEAGIRILEYGF